MICGRHFHFHLHASMQSIGSTWPVGQYEVRVKVDPINLLIIKGASANSHRDAAQKAQWAASIARDC